MNRFIKLLQCIFFVIVIKLGFKRKSKNIPNGPYCYLPDIEKNKSKSKDDRSYYITTCPYYKWISKQLRGCTFVGYLGFDSIFPDQCKICCENCDYKNEENDDE